MAALCLTSGLHATNEVNIELDDLKLKIKVEEDLYVYFRKSELLMEQRQGDDKLVITEDFKLYHDKEPITLDTKQQELVREYYELAEYSFDKLRDIRDQGIEIGLDGAALGIKAIGKVLKLLSPTYDAEDLEREMEQEGETLEKRGERLEEEAERFEESLDHLGDMYEEMRATIPELADIEWLPVHWNAEYNYETDPGYDIDKDKKEVDD